jgi:hypothetical protein
MSIGAVNVLISGGFSGACRAGNKFELVNCAP